MVKKEQFVTVTAWNHKPWMQNHTGQWHIVALRFYVLWHKIKVPLLGFRSWEYLTALWWRWIPQGNHNNKVNTGTVNVLPFTCQKHSPNNFLQRDGREQQARNWLTKDTVNLIHSWQMAIFTNAGRLIRHKSTKREIWKLYKGVKLRRDVEATEKLIISTAGCS